jgi:hypothetical protein
LILIRRPKSAAVRREHLINQYYLVGVLIEAEFELGVCDDDASLGSVVASLERILFSPNL